jgi:threonylcarbamoyladenosine tRNA methylthiotransferase MtaB
MLAPNRSEDCKMPCIAAVGGDPCYHRPVLERPTTTHSGTSVAFRTVGCRLNQCETAQMQEALSKAGFLVVDWEQPAQVRVVNTCTVTAKSDRSCRHEIHAAKRLHPECLLAVTGCLAQVAPETLADLPEVDLVLGNPDKQDLAGHLATALRARASAQEAGSHQSGASTVAVSLYPKRLLFESESFAHFRGRTRAFLKIQTGCDSRCSYCIVPLARGPARSMPKAAVVEQVSLLTKQGYREIVLTGIDLGSWGKDTGEGSLADLLVLLLDDQRVPSLGRLRLSSVEPLELDASLLDVVWRAGDRMARHFHLPLQSGSDSVLERMARPYSGAQYLEVARDLARRLPDAAIGADIIVGFPGETEAEFEDTLALVNASPLTYLHVFGYSDRPGTAAQAMGEKISPEVIKRRSERLRRLGANKKQAFRGRLVGSEQRALVLDESAEDGRLVGLTGNYMEVLVENDGSLLNRFVRVRLDRPLAAGRWEVMVLKKES